MFRLYGVDDESDDIQLILNDSYANYSYRSKDVKFIKNVLIGSIRNLYGYVAFI